MNMTWKRVLLSLLALLLLLVLAGYLHLRSIGLLRAPVYDTEAPTLPAMSSPAILVLYKTNGFIHKDAIPAANQMLREMAVQEGWELFVTDNGATHNSEDLQRFDAVIWNNTSGDILNDGQKAAFKGWLEGGGRWLGLHAAGGDPSYAWSWHPQTLIAAQFFSHTGDPQFQDADVLVVSESPLTAHLPSPWRVPQEEWYAFRSNPRDTGSEILLTVDETTYDTGGGLVFDEATMPGEHPVAWRHSVGEGKVIYSSIGHQAATYSIPEYRDFLRKAIRELVAP
jgi:type 1 glutamine amidotransferase